MAFPRSHPSHKTLTRLGALSGPISFSLFFTAWILAGYSPPLAPTLTPEQAILHYRSRETRIKAAVPLILLFGVFYLAFRATVSSQLARIEGVVKVLVYTQ